MNDLHHSFIVALGGVGLSFLTADEESPSVVVEDGLVSITVAEDDWYPIEHALMVASRYAAEAEDGEPGATYTTAMDLPGRDAQDAACGFVKQHGDSFDAENARRKTRPWSGVDRIAKERRRQMEQEGWTLGRDRGYTGGDLALAAVAYASPLPVMVNKSGDGWTLVDPWPWSSEWDKRPREALGEITILSHPAFRSRATRIRELEKAGALIAAELDRLVAEEAEANARGEQ